MMKAIVNAVYLSLLLLQGTLANEASEEHNAENEIGLNKAGGSKLGRRLVKGDWALCSSSSECLNGCCSNEYSNEFKCTPLRGGYRPYTCVGSGNPDGLLEDWVFCSTSSWCSSGCCSSEYSEDDRLKCTPLRGGYNSRICVGPESDWHNPHLASTTDGYSWTERAEFVRDKIAERFPGIRIDGDSPGRRDCSDPPCCSVPAPHSSDHCYGNALDIPPSGSYGPRVYDEDKDLGDDVVDFVIEHHGPLQIKYINWYGRIWRSPALDPPGWAPHDEHHYDHVHISIW